MPLLLRRHATAIVTCGLLLVAALASLFLTRPPSPRPLTAPVGEFSAERAMAHVTVLARRPHPPGSPEHALVREYVVRTLTELGLDVEVQRTRGVTAKYAAAGAVENVVARLHGTGPSAGAFMLVAHYDSVAAGPGAGDDASGVAAILEAVRALRTGPPLRNDIIVLMSDGEETGLLGASAFMAEHPWAGEVKLAINFEARGNAGVSSVFETSAGNGTIVREAGEAVPSLVGSSLSYEVYKRMPNDTDATVFKAHGLAVLNFAFVGNWAAYHTKRDDAEHLDHGSLQQQGNYALGLARRFGDADLGALRAPDAIFFSLPGVFVHYGHGAAFALAATALLLVAFATWRARQDGRVTLRGVLAGLVFFLASLALAGVLGALLARLAGWVHAGLGLEGSVLGSVPFGCALVCVVFGVWVGAHALVRSRLSGDEVGLGAAALLVALTFAASVKLPGASYLFLWPALGCGVRLLASRHVEASLRGGLVAVLCALPAIAILVPLVHAAYEGLGVSRAGGAMMGFLVALLAGTHPGGCYVRRDRR